MQQQLDTNQPGHPGLYVFARIYIDTQNSKIQHFLRNVNDNKPAIFATYDIYENQI